MRAAAARRAGAIALAGAGLALAGCGTRAAEDPATPVTPATPSASTHGRGLTQADVRKVTEVAATARGLPLKHPLDVVLLAPQAFHNVLREQARENEGDPERGAAFALAFNFVKPPPAGTSVHPESTESADDAVTDDILGYYDSRLDRIVVPEVPIKNQGDWMEQRAVLAHETEHALQAQYFPSIFKHEPASRDASLARLSLIEGDAMLTMGAFLGAEAGAPVNRTLRRIHEITKQVALKKVMHPAAWNAHSDPLDAAPRYIRETVTFPYEAGMDFVTDVFRAGGYALVNKMYSSPPVSTAQILHPDLYLEGIKPRPIADFPVEHGYRSLGDNSLGELGIRVALEPCVKPAAAARAAAGWDGDRFRVVAAPDGALSLLWVTAWETQKDAGEFAHALESADRCFRANRAGTPKGVLSIGARREVKQRGKLVAVLRGNYAAGRGSWAAPLFAAVGPQPAPVPVSSARVPPREPLPEPQPGELQGDVYRNAWLGLVARVPPGMSAEVGQDDTLLSIDRSGSPVQGTLFLSERIATPAGNEKTLAELRTSLLSDLPDGAGELFTASNGHVETPLGRAVVRTWRVRGTDSTFRALLVPICADTGSVVILEMAGNNQARSVLDGFVDSFRWVQGRNLTACEYLDPK